MKLNVTILMGIIILTTFVVGGAIGLGSGIYLNKYHYQHTYTENDSLKIVIKSLNSLLIDTVSNLNKTIRTDKLIIKAHLKFQKEIMNERRLSKKETKRD